jgi:hypothetical protein
VLDIALSDIAAYYVENLPRNTKIALINFDAEAQILSDYVFEELWIRFEDSKSFVLVGAYEEPFVIQSNLTGLLSNNLLVRSITAERENSRTEMRPVATAKFTYNIGP